MTKLYNVFGLIFTVIATVNSQFRFDYSFNAKVGGWLKLHVMPATFHDAFRKCEAEGAVLASPLNIYLKNAMVTLYKKSLGPNCAIYTGIHSSVAKSSFASIEGKPLDRIPVEWAPNEPDNYNDNEACIAMLQNGSMADVSCSETFPYICFKKKTVNMALNECGTIDNEYYLDSRTGSCYKFQPIGRTWRQGYMTCMAEGGHLVIINSEIEAQVIKDLFARYPREKVHSPTKDVASIGVHDWDEPGVWFTSHGKKLQESGYSTFAAGQPDNNTDFNKSGSHCAGIHRDGTLYDLWCTGHYSPFICEKSPDSLLAQDEEL